MQTKVIVSHQSPRVVGQRASESGVFAVFLAIGLVALIGALAFAIDIPQKEVVVQEMRLAVDAASLGGAQRLDGTVNGVHQAVLMVDDLMARNPVSGKPISEDRYTIEVGFYSFPDKNFRLLALGSDYRDPERLPRDEYGSVPVAAMANAVRVQATATAPSVFSGIFGLLDLGTVSGSSVATANSNPRVCAFPVGIPFCSLFLNQDPNRIDQVTTEDFEAESQCQRPVYLSNANFDYDQQLGRSADGTRDLAEDRYGGLARAIEYSRRPRIRFTGNNLCGVGTGQEGSNCLTKPIFGTFLLPRQRDVDGDGSLDGDSDGDGKASAEEFATFISKLLQQRGTQQVGCVDFLMGESVSPVDYSSFVAPVGTPSPGAGQRALIVPETVDRTMRDLFQSSASKPFTDVFGDWMQAATKPLAPNYPYLMSSSIDRVTGDGRVRTVGPQMGEYAWTNPLCHSGMTQANDRAQARVVPVVVPVIMPAPDLVDRGVRSVRYCDPNTEVGDNPLVMSSAPNSETRPQIVGFVEVNLVDFNFEWFGERAPEYSNAMGGTLRDTHSLGGVAR